MLSKDGRRGPKSVLSAKVKRKKKLKLVFPSHFYHTNFPLLRFLPISVVRAAESTRNSIHIRRYLIYTSFDRSRRTYRSVRTRSIDRHGEDVRQLWRLSYEPAKWKDNGRRHFALFARKTAPNKGEKTFRFETESRPSFSSFI